MTRRHKKLRRLILALLMGEAMGEAMGEEEQIQEETQVMQDLTSEETLEAENSNPLAPTAAFLHMWPEMA